MTEKQAIQLLQFHALDHQNVGHPLMEQGFLGMLKYYSGELNEDNFHEVMDAIRCLACQLQHDLVERTLVANLYGICFSAWIWGIKPDSMLQRENRISEAEVLQLQVWTDCIYWTTTLLLNGADFDEAFSSYNDYLRKNSLAAA